MTVSRTDTQQIKDSLTQNTELFFFNLKEKKKKKGRSWRLLTNYDGDRVPVHWRHPADTT